MVKQSWDYESKNLTRERYRNFIIKHFPKKKQRKDLEVYFMPGYDEYTKNSLEILQVYDSLKIPRENLTGIEADKKIYDKLAKANLGINLYYGRDVDFFNETDKKFDIISLDYTGMFNLNVINKIFSKQFLSEKSILHTNFFGSRETKKVISDYRTPIRARIAHMIAENYFHKDPIFNIKEIGDEYLKNANLKEERDFGISRTIVENAPDGKILDSEDMKKSLVENEVLAELFEILKDLNLKHLFTFCYLGYLKQIAEFQGFDTAYGAALSNFYVWKKCSPYFCEDLEREKYLSETKSPMYVDRFYFQQHPEWFDESKYTVKILWDADIPCFFFGDNPIFIKKSIKQVLYVSNQFDRIKRKFLSREREDLGSSYRSKATKERIKEALLDEEKGENWIYENLRDVDTRTVAAVKAHITMGTYNKQNK